MAVRLVRNEHAATVVGAPYDALTPIERRRLIETEPDSFFGVIRSTLEFPDAQAAALLSANTRRLGRLIDNGFYSLLGEPALYRYEIVSPTHRQVALVGSIATSAVAHGVVRGHELTRPTKEDDLLAYGATVGFDSSPVGLTYRASPDVDSVVERSMVGPPSLDFLTVDEVRHRVWRLGETMGAELQGLLSRVDRAIIFDGHHRVAAAARAGSATFFAALVPHDQLRLLPYHRIIASPPLDLLDRLRRCGATPLARLQLPKPGTIVIVTPQRAAWTLPLPGGDRTPEVMKADLLLPRLFDIVEPRHDSRLSYLPGDRPAGPLADRLPPGCAAVLLGPLAIEALFRYVDRGALLAPKSTWFEPRLRSGLFLAPR